MEGVHSGKKKTLNQNRQTTFWCHFRRWGLSTQISLSRRSYKLLFIQSGFQSLLQSAVKCEHLPLKAYVGCFLPAHLWCTRAKPLSHKRQSTTCIFNFMRLIPLEYRGYDLFYGGKREQWWGCSAKLRCSFSSSYYKCPRCTKFFDWRKNL